MKLLLTGAVHLEMLADQVVLAATWLRAAGLPHGAATLDRLAARQHRGADDLARIGVAAELVRSTDE